MKRLTPDVPFCNSNYYHCRQVVLDATLRFYGYESPVLMHDQWFFLYQRQDMQIRCRYTSLSQSLQQCGIGISDHHEINGEVAWTHVRSLINQGNPVPIWIDPSPFEPHYFPRARSGQSTEHAVILGGYDDTAETVHVVDPSPAKLFRGDLPLSAVHSAWGAETPKPGYHWTEFQLPNPPWSLSAEQAIGMMRQNAEWMLTRKSPAGIFVGLDGMRKFADDLTHWQNLEADRVSILFKKLFDHLRFLVSEREGYGKYLSLVAEVLKKPELTQLSSQLHRIMQKWLVFRNLCLKGQKRAQKETLVKLPGRLQEIISLEEKAIVQLQSAIARL